MNKAYTLFLHDLPSSWYLWFQIWKWHRRYRSHQRQNFVSICRYIVMHFVLLMLNIFETIWGVRGSQFNFIEKLREKDFHCFFLNGKCSNQSQPPFHPFSYKCGTIWFHDFTVEVEVRGTFKKAVVRAAEETTFTRQTTHWGSHAISVIGDELVNTLALHLLLRRSSKTMLASVFSISVLKLYVAICKRERSYLSDLASKIKVALIK